MTLVTKVNQTVDEHKLLQRGDSVLVALSGGPDSVALLHVLIGLKKRATGVWNRPINKHKNANR